MSSKSPLTAPFPHPPRADWKGAVSTLAALPEPDLPEVAFWGRSNVGKSSWLNALMCRKNLARSGKTAGTTQAIHCYVLNQALRLIDLPGYGYAEAPQAVSARWNALSIRYLQERACLKGLVWLVDIRHPSLKLDLPVLQWLISQDLPLSVVANKADKLSKRELSQKLRQLQHTLHLSVPPVLASAKTKQGYAELWQLLETCAAAPPLPLAT